ncbi:(2Fe-2S)-binding protein [Dongshaea marina]|uniref:(2Fe-2S)-binding protein n=1 Tax=Dongshaea marina TaxID=2047966 RepID=UPI001902BBD0|nr:2Fe-2S iron-sulfur cluster-binding protein [Dongshaea marina]
MKLSFILNGERRELETDPLRSLLDLLRSELRAVATKEGCGEGECGACSVLMNDKLVNSCLIPAIQAQGAQILTLEGLKETAHGQSLTRAFRQAGAVQCGFCTRAC